MVAVPPVRVVVPPVPVVALVGVVAALRDVVVDVSALVRVAVARGHVAVPVIALVRVVPARGDMPVTVVPGVRVMTASGHVVMHVRARPGIVVALVRMAMHDRARRVRLMNLRRWPHAAHAGDAVNAGHPRDARDPRSDIAGHQAPSRIGVREARGSRNSTPGLNRCPPAVPPRRPEAVQRTAERPRGPIA